MKLKETSLEDLNKISNKIEHPNKSEDYQYCVKAYALRINKYYEESIKLYQKALKLDKKNIEALKGISLCYQSLGDYEKAIKYYNEIKFITPFDKTVHYEIGILEYNRKCFMKAIKNFINAVKLAPEYYDAIYALGQAHEAVEEYEMAEMIYLKIIENRPSYLLAYNRLANMYLHLERYNKSIRYFKEILAINPEFHRAYLGMAIAYDRSEHTSDARRYYKKYLEMKPFSDDKEYVLERLKKLRPQRSTVSESNIQLVLVK